MMESAVMLVPNPAVSEDPGVDLELQLFPVNYSPPPVISHVMVAAGRGIPMIATSSRVRARRGRELARLDIGGF